MALFLGNLGKCEIPVSFPVVRVPPFDLTMVQGTLPFTVLLIPVQKEAGHHATFCEVITEEVHIRLFLVVLHH